VSVYKIENNKLDKNIIIKYNLIKINVANNIFYENLIPTKEKQKFLHKNNTRIVKDFNYLRVKVTFNIINQQQSRIIL
jgi:hypothetical protein